MGAGRFARVIANTMRQMASVHCYAVAARDGERAQAFAQEFGFDTCYGSYEAMLADPNVELVYMPMAKTIAEVVSSGWLGRIHSLSTNLGYPVAHLERLQKPELGGGALLDIGVYPLTFASICFGEDILEITQARSFPPRGSTNRARPSSSTATASAHMSTARI